jgi:hypothetical protein
MAQSKLALNPLPLEDPEGGALSLTRVSGLAAAIIAVLTTIDGSWETIFGADTPEWAKPVFLMAVVGAWALVAAADIVGRGYAAGRKGQVIPLPEGLTAVYFPAANQKWTVAGMRPTSNDDAEFLLVKADGRSRWASRDDLEFEKP